MIVMDPALAQRVQAGEETPADRAKLALMYAADTEGVGVYSEEPEEGAQLPAVFVRFSAMSARRTLGAASRWEFEAELWARLKDGEAGDGAGREMERLLAAVEAPGYKGERFICLCRRAERARAGEPGQCVLRCTAAAELTERRIDSEGIMQMLEETVGV